MAWSLSQAMVEEMEDRLLELFTQAEKKAAKVNEKARLAATGEIKKPLSDTETSHTDSQAAAQEKRKPLGVTREKKAIRTGGMGAMVGSSSSNSAESRPSTSAGTGTGSKTKLTEATPGVTVTRPTTAPDKQPPAQGQQGADKGRLFGGKRPSAPAWALRKSDSRPLGAGVGSLASVLSAAAIAAVLQITLTPNFQHQLLKVVGLLGIRISCRYWGSQYLGERAWTDISSPWK